MGNARVTDTAADIDDTAACPGSAQLSEERVTWLCRPDPDPGVHDPGAVSHLMMYGGEPSADGTPTTSPVRSSPTTSQPPTRARIGTISRRGSSLLTGARRREGDAARIPGTSAARR